MKISKKLIVSLSILSLFVIISGIIGIMSTGAINQKLLIVTKVASPAVEEVDDMTISLWKINQIMQKFSVEWEQGVLDELRLEFQRINQEFLESEVAVQSLINDKAMVANLNTASKKKDIVEENAIKVMNLRVRELESTSGEDKSLYRSRKIEALAEVENAVSDAIIILDEISVRAKTLSLTADAESYDAVRNTRIILLLMTFLSIGCAVVIALYLSRSLLKPINTLSEAASRVSTGNFDVEIEERDGADEITDLTSTFNQMTKSLKKMIEESPRMKKFLQLKPVQKNGVVGQATFDLELKSSYVIKEESSKKAWSIVAEKIQKGFNGLGITRTNPSVIKEKYGVGNIMTVWLSDTKEKTIKSTSNLNELYKIIMEAIEKNQRTIIIVDRIDYLITKHGFGDVLKFIVRVNDKIMVSPAILLVPVDPSTVSMKELSYLEKELKDLPQPGVQIGLAGDLMDIVRFVNNRRVMGKVVTYKDVGHEFDITAPTTQKKIRSLEGEGLIQVVKKGREKLIYLTENAESLIS